ncbi:SAF domain-containing protein [Kitasatospora sp. NPDC052896]|uniref:SAF domain-containing protein n=1 Tax=Kitasatospora sp. NPDC052896 TaxID=3364061 RepID=UPI0037C74A1A
MENRTFPAPTLGRSAFGWEQAAGVAVPARSEERPDPVAPSRSLRARRRRPAVIAMAAALIAAGGLGGAVLYNSTGQRIAVLALARDVPYGQPLTAADLVVARIASDPALAPVTAADEQLAIGQRATTDLHRGALLLVADITRALVVQPDQQVVGVSLKRGQLPAGDLEAGQQVVLVLTGDPSTGGLPGGSPTTMNAVVADASKPDSDGGQVVNVAVPASNGPTLAAWVASGRVEVILAARSPSSSPQASSSPSTGGQSGGGS